MDPAKTKRFKRIGLESTSVSLEPAIPDSGQSMSLLAYLSSKVQVPVYTEPDMEPNLDTKQGRGGRGPLRRNKQDVVSLDRKVTMSGRSRVLAPQPAPRSTDTESVSLQVVGDPPAPALRLGHIGLESASLPPKPVRLDPVFPDSVCPMTTPVLDPYLGSRLAICVGNRGPARRRQGRPILPASPVRSSATSLVTPPPKTAAPPAVRGPAMRRHGRPMLPTSPVRSSAASPVTPSPKTAAPSAVLPSESAATAAAPSPEPAASPLQGNRSSAKRGHHGRAAGGRRRKGSKVARRHRGSAVDLRCQGSPLPSNRDSQRSSNAETPVPSETESWVESVPVPVLPSDPVAVQPNASVPMVPPAPADLRCHVSLLSGHTDSCVPASVSSSAPAPMQPPVNVLPGVSAARASQIPQSYHEAYRPSVSNSFVPPGSLADILPVCVSACLPACMSASVFVRLSSSQSSCPPDLFTRMLLCQTACLSACLTVCQLVCMSLRMSHVVSVCLSVCLNACLSVCLPNCLVV